jgi:hypothetical protein
VVTDFAAVEKEKAAYMWWLKSADRSASDPGSKL